MRLSSAGGMILMQILFLAPGALAGTDDMPAGITVVGQGIASARPGIVEIPATVTGDGELAADASIRYRDARRRVVEAIEGLKIEGLSIESSGVTVTQPQDPAMQQMRLAAAAGVANVSTDPVRQKVAVTEQLRLVLKGADKMETQKLLETLLKVLDVGRDNGLQVGAGAELQAAAGPSQGVMIQSIQPSIVTYRLADVAGVRDQAYRSAVEDARTRAARLAEASGLKLGRVMAIREQPAATDVRAEGEGESSLLGQISVRVKLSVQFEIVR